MNILDRFLLWVGRPERRMQRCGADRGNLKSDQSGAIMIAGVFMAALLAAGPAAGEDLLQIYREAQKYDPAIAADWGLVDPILSARDQANPARSELSGQWKPHFNLRP